MCTENPHTSACVCACVRVLRLLACASTSHPLSPPLCLFVSLTHTLWACARVGRNACDVCSFLRRWACEWGQDRWSHSCPRSRHRCIAPSKSIPRVHRSCADVTWHRFSCPPSPTRYRPLSPSTTPSTASTASSDHHCERVSARERERKRERECAGGRWGESRRE